MKHVLLMNVSQDEQNVLKHGAKSVICDVATLADKDGMQIPARHVFEGDLEREREERKSEGEGMGEGEQAKRTMG